MTLWPIIETITYEVEADTPEEAADLAEARDDFPSDVIVDERVIDDPPEKEAGDAA